MARNNFELWIDPQMKSWLLGLVTGNVIGLMVGVFLF